MRLAFPFFCVCVCNTVAPYLYCVRFISNVRIVTHYLYKYIYILEIPRERFLSPARKLVLSAAVGCGKDNEVKGTHTQASLLNKKKKRTTSFFLFIILLYFYTRAKKKYFLLITYTK